jgi:hypothetical protein
MILALIVIDEYYNTDNQCKMLFLLFSGVGFIGRICNYLILMCVLFAVFELFALGLKRIRNCLTLHINN